MQPKPSVWENSIEKRRKKREGAILDLLLTLAQSTAEEQNRTLVLGTLCILVNPPLPDVATEQKRSSTCAHLLCHLFCSSNSALVAKILVYMLGEGYEATLGQLLRTIVQFALLPACTPIS